MSAEEKVDYENLFPHEFEKRLKTRPIGYLPLGTLEWHGKHNVFGADALQSRELFRRAARRFGGIVMPPIWMGPDGIKRQEQGSDLIGMDTAESTIPNQQLPGSLYWVPKELFLSLVEAMLAQAKRAGFKCIIADGHGPSRIAWAEKVDAWEKQFDLKLISALRDFPDQWRTQNDHAGCNETSIMMAVDSSLVDLSRLSTDRDQWPQGVAGEDPRNATVLFGEELIEDTVSLIGKRLDELKL